MGGAAGARHETARDELPERQKPLDRLVDLSQNLLDGAAQGARGHDVLVAAGRFPLLHDANTPEISLRGAV